MLLPSWLKRGIMGSMTEHPSTPQNYRIYAVGDIHGRIDLLTRLLDKIEQDAAKHEDKVRKLVFLGDYMDRGLDPRSVVERLCQGFSPVLEPTFLRGNHDEMVMEFMKGNYGIVPVWLRTGGATTLASYGAPPLSTYDPEKAEKAAQALVEKMPVHHQKFLQQTKTHVIFGDYYFVHAGIDPDRPLDQQKPEDQLWIRNAFVRRDEVYEKMIVHGHTVVPKVECARGRISVDTGAYATGKLTCLILDGTHRTHIQG